MTRVLTNDEIEDILDFIIPQHGIPESSAKSTVEINKRSFRKQLVGQMVYPDIIPLLKRELEKEYNSALIQPGESVGVICAQSIGEKNTQTALNTFHKAGQSEKTMTEGVPRFQELLNATKNPKMINHKIFFKEGSDSIKNLRRTINNTIAGFVMKDLIHLDGIDIIMDKEPEPWYDMFKLLYDNNFESCTHCLRVKLKKKKIYEFMITESYIADVINSTYEDIYCIFSPFEEGILYIYVDTSDVVSKMTNPIAFVNNYNAIEIYLEDVVQVNIENLHICGIHGVSEIFYTKEIGDEWIIETNAELTKENSFVKILALPFVDKERTCSNNIWDIYHVLGIEATKEFLIEEFMLIMDGINTCHARLLVDRMTFDGSIASISRYTLKNDECGPMGKASFEESLDNFLIAAMNGEVETTNGVSAAIICGKRSNIGTGMMGLSMNMEMIH